MKAVDLIKEINEENSSEMLSFDVEIWSKDDSTFVIYHKPFTLSDVDWITRQSKGSKGKELALTVIRKALDSDGNKMFTLADLNFLLKGVKSADMVEIVNRLNADDNNTDYRKE